MASYHLAAARLPSGWARDVTVTVNEQGIISALQAGGRPDGAERIAGAVITGMANAHSHAFQRAMAGDAERRQDGRDSFWSWRQQMYQLAQTIEPDELEIVATQLFIEMLKAGYSSVAEFHYLHRQRSGEGYGNRNALWDAIDAAARSTGIAVTLLPALYATSDFGGEPLRAEQARFRLSLEEWLDAIAHRHARSVREPAGACATGAAFHSLRAVPIALLREAVEGLSRIDRSLPIHIHVAEQLLEVQSCERATGRRPIDLLVDTGLVGPNWCLVHATHASATEIERVAAAGAAICVCPGTEGNLGDGFFDAQRWRETGGTLCIGSDSQVTISPSEELRWLEYQQRLHRRRRAMLATEAEPHVGASLWHAAAERGAHLLAQPTGALQAGRRADWLVLDETHPTLAGAAGDALLDRLVFAGGQAAIRDVMVAGRWVVRDGHHALEQSSARRYAALMARRRGAES
jgi:formimidoylglutamate deiminase